jgi:hypothetical protein
MDNGQLVANFKPLPFDFTRASSGTTVNQSGLIETVGSGIPRIDFQGNTKGALLLEFGSTGWSFVTAGTAITPIVTDDYAISPDGTQNAQRVQFNLGGGTTLSDRTVIRQNIGAQTDWFLSVYMKSTNGAEQKILWQTNADSNQTVVTGEWQRFTFSRNGVTNTWAGLSLRGSISSVDTADILVYGFQAEQGSYATSYIPTSGSAVTRVADACNNGGNNQVINSSEGVLYAEISALAADGTFRNMSISDGSTSNLIALMFTNSNTIRLDFSNQAQLFDNTTNITNYNKIAFSYKLNQLKLYVNGALKESVLSATMLSNLNTLRFDNTIGAPFYGNIKDIRVYNTALTDAELIALTT